MILYQLKSIWKSLQTKNCPNTQQQELSISWDGRPFGHNRHGPKRADGLLLRVGIPYKLCFP